MIAPGWAMPNEIERVGEADAAHRVVGGAPWMSVKKLLLTRSPVAWSWKS